MDNPYCMEEQLIYKKLGGRHVDNGRNGEKSIEYFRPDLAEMFAILEDNKEISASRPIFSGSSGGGRIKFLIKKLVRKCLTWYLKPICNQQTEFNCAVLDILNELTKRQEEEGKNNPTAECKATQSTQLTDELEIVNIAKSD